MTATPIPVARPKVTTAVHTTTVETRTTGCRRVTESTSSLGAWYSSMLARSADLPGTPQGIQPHLRNGSYLSLAIVTPLLVGLSRGDAAGQILRWSGGGRRKDRPTNWAPPGRRAPCPPDGRARRPVDCRRGQTSGLPAAHPGLGDRLPGVRPGPPRGGQGRSR